TQQHHLNALAPLRISVPAQRCLQPTDLAFGAFDHLFPPNQMVPANHTSRPENNSLRGSAPSTKKHLDSISYGSGMTSFPPWSTPSSKLWSGSAARHRNPRRGSAAHPRMEVPITPTADHDPAKVGKFASLNCGDSAARLQQLSP